MPNLIAKNLEIAFEETVEGFDAACVLSRECDTVFPEPQTMQRAGDTYFVSQDYQTEVVQGLDVSGAARTDLIDRKVPTVFRQPDNVLWELDAKELRDPQHMKKIGIAASLRLASEIDKNLYTTVGSQASIYVKKTGPMVWSDGAMAEALLLSRGVSNGGDRKLFMNPFDWKDVSVELGNKAYMTDWSKDAYARSQVPNIAMFRTFRTDNQYNQPVGAGPATGLTLAAAAAFVPSSMTGDVPTDNRRMTMTIAGANVANLVNGAAFHITGVSALHNIDKSDTGQPLTFRVVSGGGTPSIVVTPALVAVGPYRNASQAGANGAPLVVLSTTARSLNPFWVGGAVCLDFGKLAFPDGEGAEVKTATTVQGVPLTMSYAFNHLTGKCTVRYHVLYATTVRNPEACGVIAPNQA